MGGTGVVGGGGLVVGGAVVVVGHRPTASGPASAGSIGVDPSGQAVVVVIGRKQSSTPSPSESIISVFLVGLNQSEVLQ